MEHAQRGDLALQRRATGRGLVIGSAHVVQHPDDAIASQVRRVGHRRTPVAIGANEDVLANERGIRDDECAHGVGVIAPDGVGEPDRVDEPRPTRRGVTSREHELRIGELRGRGIRRLRMVRAPLGERTGVAGLDGTEEFFRLTMKLVEI
jgi:hypothetical protein